MSAKRYHLISAKIALILALVNTLLVSILNGPSYLKSGLNRPKNPLVLLLIPTLGIIFALIVVISWIKRHYYRDFEIKSDFIKYGAMRGFLLPIVTLLAGSVIAHSVSILYVLNSSTPGIWAIVIHWSEFYLYLLPIVVFSPLLTIFIAIGALIEKRVYH